MAKLKDITYNITNTGCWICTSHKPNTTGYFTIFINGKRMKMHKYIYMREFGEIKGGNIVRHICDNPSCINPNHLIEGTHKDNSQDMIDRNRNAKGSEHSNSKLTEQEVLEILNNSTDHNAKLARKYKVSSAVISNIKLGKTWKHIFSLITL